MKKIILLSFITLSICVSAQSNEEISEIYFNRANDSYNQKEIEKALKLYDKAVSLIPSVENNQYASLGALINYQLKNYDDAKKCINLYFELTPEKGALKYQTMLELYVTIEDKMDQIEEQKKLAEEARILKEKEQQKISELKQSWNGLAEEFLIKVDTIHKLNKYNVALFEDKGEFGLMNDKGTIILDKKGHKNAFSFDGYFILTNDKKEPTKITCYDSSINNSFILPTISKLNSLSTHYEKIMYPRGNGILVLYPNNTIKTLFYDLKSNSVLSIDDNKELLKDLKDSEVIEKYKKDIEIMIDGQWYLFGGSFIGGGVYPLYLSNQSIYGYLFSSGRNKVVLKDTYNYVGAFYNKRIQVETNEGTFWVDANGGKSKAPVNESGKYTGTSEIVKIDDENYFIYKNIDGERTIIKGDKEIMTLNNYLLKNKDQ